MFLLIRSLSRCLVILFACIAATPLAAQQFREIEQGYPGIVVEELFNGLGVPWGIAFISPHQLLVTERAGRILLIDIKKLLLLPSKVHPKSSLKARAACLM